jgi:hypothetical protein
MALKPFGKQYPSPPDLTRKINPTQSFVPETFDQEHWETKFTKMGRDFELGGKDLVNYVQEQVGKKEERHMKTETDREERMRREREEWEKVETDRIRDIKEKWAHEIDLWKTEKSDWDANERLRVEEERRQKDKEEREARERKEVQRLQDEKDARDQNELEMKDKLLQLSQELVKTQERMQGTAELNNTLMGEIKLGNKNVADLVKKKGESDSYKLHLQPLKESDDVEKFFEQFDRVAELNKWNNEKCATRIIPLLTGKARDAYLKMKKDDIKNYEQIKNCVLQEYQLTAEHYHLKFRNIQKNANENFKQFADRIIRLFEKWVTLSDVDKDYARLSQLVMLETFYNSLTDEMSIHIRGKEPNTIEDAAKYAFDYVEHRRATGMAKKMFGHKSNPNPGSKQPPGAGINRVQGDAKDHNANRNEIDAKRKAAALERERLKKEGKCFKCKGPYNGRAHQCPTSGIGCMQNAGDIANTDPDDASGIGRIQSDKNTDKENQTSDPLWSHLKPLCDACEHVEWEREINIRVNGVTVTALRDTGADELVVCPSLVKQEDYLKSRTKVKLAVSEMQGIYPRAIVDMDSPFVKGRVQCVVVAGINPKVFIGDTVKRENGTKEHVSVYPKSSLMTVQTRNQVKKEQEKKDQMRVQEIDGLDIDREQLVKMQQEDEALEWARKQAEQKKIRSKKNGHQISFEYKDGVLKRIFKSKNERRTQVCVPKPLRMKVMKIGHDMPMAGHMGKKKTLDRIWTNFYWPGMSAHVNRYVQSCERCQKVTPKGKVPKVPLERVPMESQPFDKVAVDLIGPIYPASEGKKRFILVLVDYATRYPEAVALKGIETTEVAEALIDIFSRIGVPLTILTDQGSQFTSEMMKEVHRLMGMKGITTSPYHAQANGLVERFNGTLKSMLKKLTTEKPTDWDRYISAVLFAYREVPQASTGYSPFELLYGRTVRGPMAILKHLWTREKEQQQNVNPSRYVFELRNRLEETCKIAQQNLDQKAEIYKKHFDKKAHPRQFPVGGKVLLLLPEKQNKLEMSWQGPYEVQEKIGLNDYRINRKGKSQIFHANMLKRFYDDQEIKAVSVIAQTDEDQENEQEILHRDIPLMPLSQTEDYQQVKYGNVTSVVEALKKKVKEKSRIMTDLPLRCTLEEGEILQDVEGPVKGKQWPLPFSQREDTKTEVEKMEAMRVIRRSSSEYASPIVLVKKPDGTYRFCTDFRELNKKIKFDAEPIPDTAYLFAKLQRAKVFSKFDLCKGYWQIQLKEEDRHKTAFHTPDGLYEWNVLPFGLKTSGAIFSRMMRKLLKPLNDPDIDNFIDDVMVASEDTNQHIKSVSNFLDRCDEANLAVRPSKCEIGCDKVSFLGHEIEAGKIKPQKDKVEKIKQAKPPETKKQVRAFLGLAGYYRQFIPNFSTIAKPLTDATKKHCPNNIEWDTEKEESFQKLKDVLCQEPVCVLPDMEKTFYVRTDASGLGLGAMLMQPDDKGVLKIVSCASRKLKDAETRYSTVERECLGIVWAVKKFEPYLHGRKYVVQSDHQPLSWMSNIKADNKRLMRWALCLQDQNIVYEAIPGEENQGADFLSRM